MCILYVSAHGSGCARDYYQWSVSGHFRNWKRRSVLQNWSRSFEVLLEREKEAETKWTGAELNRQLHRRRLSGERTHGQTRTCSFNSSVSAPLFIEQHRRAYLKRSTTFCVVCLTPKIGFKMLSVVMVSAIAHRHLCNLSVQNTRTQFGRLPLSVSLFLRTEQQGRCPCGGPVEGKERPIL